MTKNENIERVVENICYSLRNKPYEWEVDAYTINHIPSKTEFWKSDIISFFGVWDGQTTQIIFNKEQQEKIRNAYRDMLQKKETVAERRLIHIFG